MRTLKQRVLRSVLLAVVIAIEKLDRRLLERDRKPLNNEQGNNSQLPTRPLRSEPVAFVINTATNKLYMDKDYITGTTTKSKYSAKELQEMYKENPYTNNPYKI